VLLAQNGMKRILIAEGLGTMLLVATVVGSGIMAERLAGGNDAVALLGNTAATVAMLFALIVTLGPISGASFNPAVTVAMPGDNRVPMVAMQVAGAIAGTLLAHAMFGHPILEVGAKIRTGPSQWLGEFVATFGLLLMIRLGQSHRPDALPALVAAWIAAAYWFTSSTSFANPAVTIARAMTDSFSGIRPIDVPAFAIAQIAGALVGVHLANWLIEDNTP
jgi:glycerol uptake facilitator-like aquaporin